MTTMPSVKYLSEASQNYHGRVGVDGKPLEWQANEICSLAENIVNSWKLTNLNRRFLRALTKLMYHDNVEILADDEDLCGLYNDLVTLQSGNFLEIARNDYTRVVKVAELQYLISWYVGELPENPEFLTIVNELTKDYAAYIKVQFDE